MRQYLFILLLAVSSLYALHRGGPVERIAAVVLSVGVMLTAAALLPFRHHFRHLEIGDLLIDVTMMGIFIWLSLRTSRKWPLLLAALMLAEVVIHTTCLLATRLVPLVYLDAAGLWSWLAQILLALMTWRNQRRPQSERDNPWRH